MMNSRLLALGLTVAVLATAGSAKAAPTDWFASLYSQEGVELRAEERVFALYALFNAMGYSEAPVLRNDPMVAYDFDPVRAQLRETLKLSADARKRLDAFFTAHPLPMSAYVQYVLSTEGAPHFKPTRDSSAALKGFETLLADFYAENKLGDVFTQLQVPYRAALRPYLATVDGPMASLRKVLRMKPDDLNRVVLVANPLDGRGSGQVAQVGDHTFVLVGPSANPDVYAVLRETAKARLIPTLASRKMTGLVEQATAAGFSSPQDFAIEAVGRAVALHATNASEAEINAQSGRGFSAVSAIVAHVRAYDKGDKSFEACINDALIALAISGGKK